MATATLRAVLEGFDQAVRQLEQVASGQEKVADANKKLESSANDATKPLKDMLETSEGLGNIMKGVLVLGATAATTALLGVGLKATESVKNLTELGDQVNRLAQITGVGASALTSYSLAFQTNNVSLEEGARALEQFGKRLFEAQQGNTVAGRAFRALGIDVKQFGGDTEAAMLAVADKFATMRDGAGKAAIAIELGGRTFASMIPVLNEGSNGLKKFQDEARRAGIVMSDETAKAAAELSASLTVLNAYGKGFWQEFATPVVTGMAEVARSMRDARDAGAGFFSMLLTGAQSLARVSLWGTEQGQQAGAASQLSQLGLKLGTQNAALASLDGRDDAFATITRQRILQEQAATQAQINKQYATYQRLDAWNNPLGNQAKDAAPDLPDKPSKAGRVDPDPNNVIKNYAAMWADVLKQRREHAEGMAKLANEEQEAEARARVQEARDAEKGFEAMERSEREFASRETSARERDLRDRARLSTEAAEAQIRDIRSVTEVERGDHAAALRSLLDYYEKLGPEGKEAYAKVKVAVEEVDRQQQKTIASVFELKSSLGQLALDVPAIFSTIPKSLAHEYAEILKGHESLMDGLKNIWKSFGDAVINEFARIAANATVSMVMGMLGFGGGSQGSGIGGSIAGGAASGTASSLLGGGGSMFGALAAKLGFGGGSSGAPNWMLDNGGLGGGGAAAGGEAAGGISMGALAGAAAIIAAPFIIDKLVSRPADATEMQMIQTFQNPNLQFEYDAEGSWTGRAYNVVTGDVVNAITGALTGDKMPGFATGTDSLFSRPTMIKVGENGPERVRVEPATGAGSSGGRGGVTVNVNGMALMDTYSARRMAREIKRMAAA